MGQLWGPTSTPESQLAQAIRGDTSASGDQDNPIETFKVLFADATSRGHTVKQQVPNTILVAAVMELIGSAHLDVLGRLIRTSKGVTGASATRAPLYAVMESYDKLVEWAWQTLAKLLNGMGVDPRLNQLCRWEATAFVQLMSIISSLHMFEPWDVCADYLVASLKDLVVTKPYDLNRILALNQTRLSQAQANNCTKGGGLGRIHNGGGGGGGFGTVLQPSNLNANGGQRGGEASLLIHPLVPFLQDPGLVTQIL